MAVHVSLDLDNCTFGQLLAFVDAVESAGASRSARGTLEGSTLHFHIADSAAPVHKGEEPSGVDPSKLGDLAISSLIDALSAKRR